MHKFELDTDELNILDFQEHNVLAWLAKLMKHRDAVDSKRYRMLSKQFIEKYGIPMEGYDASQGCLLWRQQYSCLNPVNG